MWERGGVLRSRRERIMGSINNWSIPVEREPLRGEWSGRYIFTSDILARLGKKGSWSTRPITNSPKNQLAQFWSTRPKTNSPNYQLAQIWSTRPIFFKIFLVNSPKTIGQLAQFFLLTRPNFDHICFMCFEKKVYC